MQVFTIPSGRLGGALVAAALALVLPLPTSALAALQKFQGSEAGFRG